MSEGSRKGGSKRKDPNKKKKKVWKKKEDSKRANEPSPGCCSLSIDEMSLTDLRRSTAWTALLIGLFSIFGIINLIVIINAETTDYGQVWFSVAGLIGRLIIVGMGLRGSYTSSAYFVNNYKWLCVVLIIFALYSGITAIITITTACDVEGAICVLPVWFLFDMMFVLLFAVVGALFAFPLGKRLTELEKEDFEAEQAQVDAAV